MALAQTSGSRSGSVQRRRWAGWLPLAAILLAAVVGGKILNDSLNTLCVWAPYTRVLSGFNGIREDHPAMLRQEMLSGLSPDDRPLLDVPNWYGTAEEAARNAQAAYDRAPDNRALLANLIERRIWQWTAHTKKDSDEVRDIANPIFPLLDKLESMEEGNGYAHLLRSGLHMTAYKIDDSADNEVFKTEYQWGTTRQSITCPKIRITDENRMRQAMDEFHQAAIAPRLESPTAPNRLRLAKTLMPTSMAQASLCPVYYSPSLNTRISIYWPMSVAPVYAVHLATKGEFDTAHRLLDDHQRIAGNLVQSATSDLDVRTAAEHLANSMAFRAMVYQVQGDSDRQARSAKDCEMTLVLMDNLTRPHGVADIERYASRMGFIHAGMGWPVVDDSLALASRRLEYAWLDQIPPAIPMALLVCWLLLLSIVRIIRRWRGAEAGPDLMPSVRRIAVISAATAMPWLGYLAYCWWPGSRWREYGMGYTPGTQLGGYAAAMALSVLVAWYSSRRSVAGVARSLGLPPGPSRPIWRTIGVVLKYLLLLIVLALCALVLLTTPESVRRGFQSAPVGWTFMLLAGAVGLALLCYLLRSIGRHGFGLIVRLLGLLVLGVVMVGGISLVISTASALWVAAAQIAAIIALSLLLLVLLWRRSSSRLCRQAPVRVSTPIPTTTCIVLALLVTTLATYVPLRLLETRCAKEFAVRLWDASNQVHLNDLREWVINESSVVASDPR